MINSIRARVEHAIRRVKQHACVANLYTGAKRSSATTLACLWLEEQIQGLKPGAKRSSATTLA